MDNPTWTPRNTFFKILPYVFLNKNSHICEPGESCHWRHGQWILLESWSDGRRLGKRKDKENNMSLCSVIPSSGNSFSCFFSCINFHVSIQRINDSFMVLDSDSLRNALFATIPHEQPRNSCHVEKLWLLNVWLRTHPAGSVISVITYKGFKFFFEGSVKKNIKDFIALYWSCVEIIFQPYRNK